MKYVNLIDPYLHGHLTPEEEVLFENQLARDPALAEETARRFREGDASSPVSSQNDVHEQISVAEHSRTPFKIERD